MPITGTWINIGATAITAVATAVTAVLMWREGRRRAAESDPVVECTARWAGKRQLILNIVVRNKLPVSIEVTRARLVRPRGGKIAKDRTRDEGGGFAGFEVPRNREIRIGYSVAPLGTEQSPQMRGLPGFSQATRVDIRSEEHTSALQSLMSI